MSSSDVQATPAMASGRATGTPGERQLPHDERAVSSKSNDVAKKLSSATNAIKEVATENARVAEAKQDKSVALLTSVTQELEEAITVLNESLAKTPTRAVISKDEVLNRFIVKIADKRSGEIVREVPPEALLKFARQLQELKGILFDERS
jgi:flagellar protein FlaG